MEKAEAVVTAFKKYLPRSTCRPDGNNVTQILADIMTNIGLRNFSFASAGLANSRTSSDGCLPNCVEGRSAVIARIPSIDLVADDRTVVNGGSQTSKEECSVEQ